MNQIKAAVLIATALLWNETAARAQVLVGSPFTSPISDWVDAFPYPIRTGNWRLSLHNPVLMDTNNANPPTSGATNNDGTYQPDVLVANAFTTPATYELSAQMRTNDDDIIGLVWNYVDPNNYFRVGIRQQPSGGSFGGTDGLSVQKISGGGVTQLIGPGVASPVTQTMIDTRELFDLKVAVNGQSYEVFFNGVSVGSGSDLALTGGKVGIQSWAQQADAAAVTPFWGTEVESITVANGPTVLFNQSFASRPVQWRQVVMTNAVGISGATTGTTKEILGNFGLGINDRWIHQHSNGFLNATVSNTDFIGPGVVVNEPGSLAFSDYDLRVRLGAADDDGIGVLVRVQDDNNFYRIIFTSQATGAGVTRAPRGMSVQKVRNGFWSELYRDDLAPLFVHPGVPPLTGTLPLTPSTGLPMFDLSVKAVGNTLAIEVIDSFGSTFTYPLITDLVDPLLTGTVGLSTWGSDNTYYMGYGGVLDAPLLLQIPEPSAAVLVFAGAVAGLARRRRRV